MKGRARFWGSLGASTATALGALVFIGQIVGKWSEGGWAVLISFSALVVTAHAILLSPAGRRDPRQIHRIVREKARVQGSMASIVEWQSLRMQEYRYSLINAFIRFFEIFGIHSPLEENQPVPAGDYDHALHGDHPDAPSLLIHYLAPATAPLLGGKPKETIPSDE
jgi:hypothetical protein